MANEPPAVAVIACPSADQAPNAHMMAECCKNLRARKLIDITTIMVGPHASGQPYEVMSDLNVDYIIQGEGETPLFQLVSALYQRGGWDKIPGLGYRNNYGTSTINPPGPVVEDIDLFPMPARHLLNMQRYTYGPSMYGQALTPHTTMMLSRGCPSECAYCPIPRILGTDFRKRSPGRILDEIEMLQHEYSIREVQFIGDNIFHDRKWAREWMKLFIDTGLEIQWSSQSGQSLYNFDLDMAELAVASGMRQMALDITCGDPDAYSDAWKRPGDVTDAVKLVRFLKKKRVFLTGLFRLGMPGETRADMARTVSYAFSLGLHELEFRAQTPLPGTPLWDMCAEKNFFELIPQAKELLLENGYIQTAEFNSRQVTWQRDWARTLEKSRQLLRHPGTLALQGGMFAIKGLFHPVGALQQAWRFAKLVGGTPLDAPKAPRRPGVKAPSAPAADDF
jgi:anaerobic magnesium-protoporphyrin IX monomethyl ester cyclase